MSADGALKKRARAHAQHLGFTMSSDDDAGCEWPHYVDDGDPESRARQDDIRKSLLQHDELVNCEMAWSTGLILYVRRINA